MWLYNVTWNGWNFNLACIWLCETLFHVQNIPKHVKNPPERQAKHSLHQQAKTMLKISSLFSHPLWNPQKALGPRKFPKLLAQQSPQQQPKALRAGRGSPSFHLHLWSTLRFNIKSCMKQTVHGSKSALTKFHRYSMISTFESLALTRTSNSVCKKSLKYYNITHLQNLQTAIRAPSTNYFNIKLQSLQTQAPW